jgi:hypothetical protein
VSYRLEWPQERTDALRKHHAAGLSFKAIAELFRVTRSSVAGKCARLKLTRPGDAVANGKLGGRVTARLRREDKPKFTRQSPAILPRVNKTAWVSVPPSPDAPPSLNLSIIDVKPNQCRHMAGDKHLCCGNPVVEGTSWCDHHYRVVFWRP